LKVEQFTISATWMPVPSMLHPTERGGVDGAGADLSCAPR